MHNINVAVIYDPESNHVNTTFDYLDAFQRYSDFNIYYIAATHTIKHKITNLVFFQSVIIFYSITSVIELYSRNHQLHAALKAFTGIKIAIIQDEYDHMIRAPQWFAEIGVQCIVTDMPHGYERQMYPADILPDVTFIHALTGYISDRLLTLPVQLRPIAERPVLLGYRGRALHYKYGHLGQEKINIGKRMAAFCKERNIPCDIAWTEEKRIYGADWPQFIASCRAMLGSESGSEVFDRTGMLRNRIDAYLQGHPDADYDEIHEIFLKDIDGLIPMAQISPRIFETIICGTALVLFEGNYSGILEAEKHYIPVKKDFSNIDDVFKKISDNDFLEHITKQAYNDIVLSEKYTYKNFIKRIDDFIKQRIATTSAKSFIISRNSTLYGIPTASILPFSCFERKSQIKRFYFFIRNTKIGRKIKDALSQTFLRHIFHYV